MRARGAQSVAWCARLAAMAVGEARARARVGIDILAVYARGLACVKISFHTRGFTPSFTVTQFWQYSHLFVARRYVKFTFTVGALFIR